MNDTSDHWAEAMKKAAALKLRAEQEEKKAAKVGGSLRVPPEDDAQKSLFAPVLYDLPSSVKDSRVVMDKAVYRLSKRNKRASEVIKYDLPEGGYVEVKSGVDGMASIWDYDIVLLTISYLTDEINRYKAGERKDLPSPVFTPSVTDILKFCRRSKGGNQYQSLEEALDRLKSTTIKIVQGSKDKKLRDVNSVGLIGDYRVISSTETGVVHSIEITISRWIYNLVVEGERPDVLTLHRDFFLLKDGYGKFIYRLARQAAGYSSATWSFKRIFQNTSSEGTFKEFTRKLRNIIKRNDLPDYLLREVQGKDGPMLEMKYRKE